MENTPFGRFSAGLRRLNQLAAVAEIPVSGGLAAIFAELENAGLLNRQRWVAQRCKIRCENWSERTRTLRFGPSRRGFY